jgi:hypothetical protein
LFYFLAVLATPELPDTVGAKALQSLKAILTLQPDVKHISAFAGSLAEIATPMAQTGLTLILTLQPTLATPHLVNSLTSFQHLQPLYLTAMGSPHLAPLLLSKLSHHLSSTPATMTVPFLVRWLSAMDGEKRVALLIVVLPIVTRKMTANEAGLVLPLMESFGAEMRDVIRGLEQVDPVTVQRLAEWTRLAMTTRSQSTMNASVGVASRPAESIQLKTNFSFS